MTPTICFAIGVLIGSIIANVLNIIENNIHYGGTLTIDYLYGPGFKLSISKDPIEMAKRRKVIFLVKTGHIDKETGNITPYEEVK